MKFQPEGATSTVVAVGAPMLTPATITSPLEMPVGALSVSEVAEVPLLLLCVLLRNDGVASLPTKLMTCAAHWLLAERAVNCVVTFDTRVDSTMSAMPLPATFQRLVIRARPLMYGCVE